MKKYFAIALIVAALLLAWGVWAQSESGGATTWRDTTIQCIDGHTNLAFHFHPHLSITVDGEREIIPANVGITSSCMAEVHTHDASGELHIEGAEKSRATSFTLEDFFIVLGKDFKREGYDAEIFLDGQSLGENDPSAFILKDGQQIEVRYTQNTLEETSKEE